MLVDVRWFLIGLAAAGLTLIWVAIASRLGDIGVLLPIAMLLSLGVGYVVWQASILQERWALLAILVLSSVLLSISFRIREQGDVGLDWQNGTKIVVWGLMLATCLPHARQLSFFLADPVLMCFFSFGIICLISAAYSVVPLVSAMSAIGILAYMCFACLLVRKIPPKTLFLVLIWTFTGFCIVNLLSYFVIPDVANYQIDPVNNPSFVRFRGISGHPNLLGRIASVFALLIFATAYLRYLKPVIWLPMAVLALLTTVVTESRTSLFSVIIAFCFQIPRRFLLPIMAVGTILGGTIYLSGHIDSVLSLIGRDGDVEEAATMSGRTDLWDFSFAQIRDRPIIGYGFNSFEAYASEQWAGPAYAATVATHNNYLSVMFSTGLLGLIPFLTGFVILIRRWYVLPDLPRDLFVFNALAYGFSETDIPSISIVPTLMFFVIIDIDEYAILIKRLDAAL
jgi:O-antigen ligase